MLEKLRENPSAVVAALVAAGVLAIAIGAGGNNDNGDNATDEAQEPETVEVISDADPPAVDPEEALEEEQEQAVEDLVAVEPEEGPVVVSKEDTTLSAVVRKGDNQTLIVRQMVDDFAAQSGQSLSAEQRLYVETNVVNTLPRNDRIFENQVIEIDESAMSDIVSDARELSAEQQALWAAYL